MPGYQLTFRRIGEGCSTSHACSGKPSYVSTIELLFDLETRGSGPLSVEVAVDTLEVTRVPTRGRDAEGLPSSSRPAARPGGGRVRLTRRGRAVVLAFFLLLAGLGLVLAATASRAADPARDAPTAEVHPGDSLWSIAERYVPGRDPVAAVEEIRRLNGLTDYTVHAGQRVVLPVRR
jgi:LysM repeat protein